MQKRHYFFAEKTLKNSCNMIDWFIPVHYLLSKYAVCRITEYLQTYLNSQDIFSCTTKYKTQFFKQISDTNFLDWFEKVLLMIYQRNWIVTLSKMPTIEIFEFAKKSKLATLIFFKKSCLSRQTKVLFTHHTYYHKKR